MWNFCLPCMSCTLYLIVICDRFVSYGEIDISTLIMIGMIVKTEYCNINNSNDSILSIRCINLAFTLKKLGGATFLIFHSSFSPERGSTLLKHTYTRVVLLKIKSIFKFLSFLFLRVRLLPFLSLTCSQIHRRNKNGNVFYAAKLTSTPNRVRCFQ